MGEVRKHAKHGAPILSQIQKLLQNIEINVNKPVHAQKYQRRRRYDIDFNLEIDLKIDTKMVEVLRFGIDSKSS